MSRRPRQPPELKDELMTSIPPYAVFRKLVIKVGLVPVPTAVAVLLADPDLRASAMLLMFWRLGDLPRLWRFAHKSALSWQRAQPWTPSHEPPTPPPSPQCPPPPAKRFDGHFLHSFLDCQRPLLARIF